MLTDLASVIGQISVSSLYCASDQCYKHCHSDIDVICKNIFNAIKLFFFIYSATRNVICLFLFAQLYSDQKCHETPWLLQPSMYKGTM